jgi:hypothetical protein
LLSRINRYLWTTSVNKSSNFAKGIVKGEDNIAADEGVLEMVSSFLSSSCPFSRQFDDTGGNNLTIL